MDREYLKHIKEPEAIGLDGNLVKPADISGSMYYSMREICTILQIDYPESAKYIRKQSWVTSHDYDLCIIGEDIFLKYASLLQWLFSWTHKKPSSEHAFKVIKKLMEDFGELMLMVGLPEKRRGRGE